MTNGRREPFAIIPVRWFPKLKTAREWKVAAALASHADDETGEAFPSLAAIAARAGICRSHVAPTLAKLSAAGRLKITRRPNQSSSYRLLEWSAVGSRLAPSADGSKLAPSADDSKLEPTGRGQL